MTWRTIDSAPTEDEVEVDLWVVDFNSGLKWRQTNAWRDGGKWIFTDLQEVHEVENGGVFATHWMYPPGEPQ